MIKYNKDELLEILQTYKENHTKETYYKIRSQNPKELLDIYRAARFIYLNKTCFNGLYRVNSKGEFNVPMGTYKSPAFPDEEEMSVIASMLANIQISAKDFEAILPEARKGDFIYFDPPYHPLNNSKSFTTYTKDDFKEEDQKRLAELFRALDKKGCSVMLSNSDTDLIKKLYKGFNINTVKASRMINSDGSKRGKINELVITNYPVNTTGVSDL